MNKYVLLYMKCFSFLYSFVGLVWFLSYSYYDYVMPWHKWCIWIVNLFTMFFFYLGGNMINKLDALIEKATSGRETWLDVHHYGIMLDGTWNTGEEIEALAELLNYLVAKNKDKNGN